MMQTDSEPNWLDGPNHWWDSGGHGIDIVRYLLKLGTCKRERRSA